MCSAYTGGAAELVRTAQMCRAISKFLRSLLVKISVIVYKIHLIFVHSHKCASLYCLLIQDAEHSQSVCTWVRVCVHVRVHVCVHACVCVCGTRYQHLLYFVGQMVCATVLQ